MTSPTALAYSAFRRLPVALRRMVVRVVAPTYVVGAVIVIRNRNGQVLLLRERHHEGWGLPGGLTKRGEPGAQAAIREVREEINVTLDPAQLGTPTINVEAESRRVDVIFVCTVDDLQPRAREPEVLEARWFDADELPDLFEPTVEALRLAGIPVPDAAG